MTGNPRQFLLLLLAAGLSAIVSGCVGGPAKSGFPAWMSSGSSTDADRHARHIEVRPMESSLAIGKQLILIATVYDENGQPRPKRRVEWKIEGPGIIFGMDEGSYLKGRGFKEDSKSAVSFTDSTERTLPAGIDNPFGQTIQPGQTWCVITSAIEGESIVTVYAPEIGEAERNHVVVKTNWVDAHWQFPEPTTAKAGGEFVFTTRINRNTSNVAVNGYKVRYTLLDDNPSAGLYLVSSLKAGTPREIIVPADAEGFARATIAQPKAELRTNHVGIEILKPDPLKEGGYAIVAKSETKIDWQASQVKLSIDAPKSSPINQAFPLTFAVASTGAIDAQPMVLKAILPQGLELVATTPKATADGNELLWSLPLLPAGQQQTVQAIVRSTKTGDVIIASSVRTADNLRADATSTTQLTVAELHVSLAGPRLALVGENVPFEILVKNAGNGPATNVKVQAQYDAGLEVLNPVGGTTTIGKLDAGQSQLIPLSVSPKQAGRSALKAVVAADGNLQAQTAAAGVDVQKPELKVEAYGPARGYLNQEITWTLRVFNPSDVPEGNVTLRALLPPDVIFQKSSNDGVYSKGAVEWKLGTMVGKQWSDVQLTGVPTRLAPKSILRATIDASPLASRDGDIRTVSMIKPFASDIKTEVALEVLGVPSLQLEVSDSIDPVQVGQNVTYTIRIKNAGTLQANQVELSAVLPPQMRAVRAFGPSKGKIDGPNVTFAPIESILPNIASVFTIEAQAISEGDSRFQAQVKSLSLGSPIRSEESTRIVPKNEIRRSTP